MLNGKPVICISNDSNASSNTAGKPRQIMSPKAYSAAIAAAGGIPWLTSEFCAEELAQFCDGLLLSGGDDVEPEYFGETVLNASVSMDTERTRFEIPLAKAFLAQGKPIMTICRGIQLLNIVMGGDIYQDLVEQCGLVHMNGTIRHDVYAEEGSILHRLFGPKFKTNSTHHQAIRRLAPGFKVTARSVEGIVEAVEHESLPIFGTQFHPERLTGVQWDERTPDFAPLFSHFIEVVKERSL